MNPILGSHFDRRCVPTPRRLKPGLRTGLALTVALVWTHPAGAALFGPKGDSIPEKQATVRAQRDQMLAELYAAKPAMKERLKKAAGYATFNQKDMNLFLLASGHGYGMVVDTKSGRETFMRVGSLGGGVGMGVRSLRVIFVFNNAQTMRQFVESGWQFGGKADAAAKYQNTGLSAEQNVKAGVNFKEGTVTAGAGADARAGVNKENRTAATAATAGAMEIYQFTESGLSLQATVAGTKYWKDSKLNP